MRRAIIEPRDSGHHLLYVREILEDGDVLVTSPSVLRGERLGAVLGMDVQTRETASVDSAVARQLLRDYDAVCVLEADTTLAVWLRALSSAPGKASRLRLLLLRHPSLAGSGSRRAAKGLLARLLLISGARVGVLDLPEPPNDRLVRINDPLLHGAASRDVAVRRRPETRHRLGLSPHDQCAAVVGAITPRKNVDLIARACHQHGYRLLVAGAVSTDAFPQLERGRRLLGNAMTVVDEFLDDQALLDMVAAADVVTVVHTNPGPSGIVNLARHVGTPVLLGGAAAALRLRGETGVWTLDPGLLGAALRQVTRPLGESMPACSAMSLREFFA